MDTNTKRIEFFIRVINNHKYLYILSLLLVEDGSYTYFTLKLFEVLPFFRFMLRDFHNVKRCTRCKLDFIISKRNGRGEKIILYSNLQTICFSSRCMLDITVVLFIFQMAR